MCRYYTNADYFPVLCRLKKITAATISFTIRAFIGDNNNNSL
jgi:hypothetical protein